MASIEVVDLWSKIPPQVQMLRQQRKTEQLALKAQDVCTDLRS